MLALALVLVFIFVSSATLRGLLPSPPEGVLQPGAVGCVEFFQPQVRFAKGKLLDFQNLDHFDLVPGVDVAAAQQKTGAGPACNEGVDLVLHVFFVFDWQQVEGFAVHQMRLYVRNKKDLRLVLLPIAAVFVFAIVCLGVSHVCSLRGSQGGELLRRVHP